MKTGKILAKRFLFVPVTLLLGAFLFTACHKDSNDKNTPANKTYTISGSANGSQVVPALTDSGSGSISGTYSSSTGQLITTTTWSNLTGAPTIGGYYTGAMGVNGTLIGSAWALGSGLSGTGSFADTTTLTADQATQLTSGNWYYLLGTAANPTGEIRGQITATAQ